MGNGLGTDGINLPLHSTTKGVCKLMWARNVHTKCVRVTEMNAVVKKKAFSRVTYTSMIVNVTGVTFQLDV